MSSSQEKAYKNVHFLGLFLGVCSTVFFIAYFSNQGNTRNLKSKSAGSIQLSITETGCEVFSLKTDEEKAELFQKFVSDYSKKYNKAESAEKYENFQKFLELIDERNANTVSAGGECSHGITKFADYTTDEFKSLLGYVKSDKPKASKFIPYSKISSVDANISTGDVNWSTIFATPIKDQGYCGSCWAFSATEQIESDSIRAGILTTKNYLSPQQIVSCDTLADGCDGGETYYAYDYVWGIGGIESASNYPYTSYEGVTGTCDDDTTDFLVTVSEFYYIEGTTTTETETLMTDYVLNYGPLSVCLDASSWASYTDGILTSCGDEVDHCVQIVGVNTDDSYWLVRNSWGTDWGLDGYIMLELGVNLCDITDIVTYVSVEAV